MEDKMQKWEFYPLDFFRSAREISGNYGIVLMYLPSEGGELI
jgi:hypothetical protein